MILFWWSLYLPELAPNVVLNLIVAALGMIRISIVPFHYGMVSRSDRVLPLFCAWPAYYIIFTAVERDLSDLLSFNGPEVLGYKLSVPSVTGWVNEVMNQVKVSVIRFRGPNSGATIWVDPSIFPYFDVMPITN
jgi:hypothetical protein